MYYQTLSNYNDVDNNNNMGLPGFGGRQDFMSQGMTQQENTANTMSEENNKQDQLYFFGNAKDDTENMRTQSFNNSSSATFLNNNDVEEYKLS